ncbi:hypothetical protein [Kutzneria sp. 744]|uniref:hypothetical protein n=1 Tax=Kutzneria sp. (strain 744) TaxID=345341 RepID=UPI0003EEC699|nr:hypothetical protein [Kutzneria sp. 744]EWM12993.1 hypothetical protein KUTG_03297 [Kutzneria sp. 744]
MSVDFYVGFGAHPDKWSCTSGTLAWVLTTTADHAQDPGLVTALRAQAARAYHCFDFSMVGREQVPELVQVLLDALLPAAEREHADDPGLVSHIRDLVALVAHWQSQHSTDLLEWGHDSALAAARRQLAAGVPMEDVLTRFRAKGFFEGDSVLAVQTLTNCDHFEAHQVVVHSQAWADQREYNGQLQAAWEGALDMLEAESGSAEAGQDHA